MTALYPPPYTAINTYLRTIRNAEKQRYGEDYADWLMHWGPEPDDDEYDLSYMAAQAVRMRLDDIVREATPPVAVPAVGRQAARDRRGIRSEGGIL